MLIRFSNSEIICSNGLDTEKLNAWLWSEEERSAVIVKHQIYVETMYAWMTNFTYSPINIKMQWNTSWRKLNIAQIMYWQNVHTLFITFSLSLYLSKQLKHEGFIVVFSKLNLAKYCVYKSNILTSDTCSVLTSHCFLYWNQNIYFNSKLVIYQYRSLEMEDGKPKAQYYRCVCLESCASNESCSGTEELWGWRPLGRKEKGKWSNVGVWNDICAGEAEMFADKSGEAECVRIKLRGERDREREEGWRDCFLSQRGPRGPVTGRVNTFQLILHVYYILIMLGDTCCTWRHWSTHGHTRDQNTIMAVHQSPRWE